MTPNESQRRIIYELTLLQYRPNVTSEESMNIGVVAYSSDTWQLEFKFTDRYGRLRHIHPELDGSSFRQITRALSSKFGVLQAAVSRDKLRLFPQQSLESLVSEVIDSNEPNLRWSSFRYGTCTDLSRRVAEVYHEYIGRMEDRPQRSRIDSDTLWRSVVHHPSMQQIAQHIDQPAELGAREYSHEFRGSWMNGKLQLAEPISLDYQEPSGIMEQAAKWSGVLKMLSREHDFMLTAIVTERPDEPSHIPKYENALEFLSEDPRIRRVIPSNRIDEFAALVAGDLSEH